MIIKVILVTVLLIFLLYSLQQREKSFLVAISIAFISMIGILFVLSPNMLSYIANLIGVGRGTDLLLYFFVVVGAIVVFNLHLKHRALVDKHTKLIRYIAIMERKLADRKLY